MLCISRVPCLINKHLHSRVLSVYFGRFSPLPEKTEMNWDKYRQEMVSLATLRIHKNNLIIHFSSLDTLLKEV